MSQDFTKVLVKDDRLMVTDQINYAVQKGGQNVTAAQFAAVSQSTSSHTYNIQVPSEQTIIDRRVLWQSTCTLQITGTLLGQPGARPAGVPLVSLSNTDSLAPFPLHQLCSVMTATINNNSVSVNMRDVLAAMLRVTDKKELQRYNGYTPTAYDTYQSYADGIGANNNVLGGWNLTSDNDLSPRGSWVVDSISSTAPGSLIFPVAPKPEDSTIYLTFRVSEPLMLSPFIFANPKSNNQGFYGIQNMNFVFNIADGNRAFRSANNYGQNVTVWGFTNSQLCMNFITPHPSDLMPSRNVVSFYELPRSISSNNPAFGPYGSPTATQVIRTVTMPLNQIPDKLIIFCRKAMGEQKCYDTDSFLVINGISINFNNQSGICASWTQQDLYSASVENHSNQSFLEFAGRAARYTAGGVLASVPTSGSVLVLEFGKDIQLTEDFASSGLLGNFSLQANITVSNQSAQAITNSELVIITVNSGVFVCERGTSSTYTGILTKQDVLDASSQDPYGRSDVERLIGGGFLDTLKSVAGKVLPKLPGLAKMGLSMMNNPYAQKGADVLGALGYGRSGGAKGRLDSKLM